MASENQPKTDASTADISLLVRKRLKWWIVASIVFVSIPVMWLLSEREPTSKEMTYAYRKYVIAAHSNSSLTEIGDAYKRLHDIELVKKNCEQQAEGAYHCRAFVMQASQLISGTHEATDAIFYHDAKGWRFSSLVTVVR